MKKTIFMAIVGFAMLATSCSTGTKVVQFTELKNYFYRNDAPKGDQLLKLTTQEDLIDISAKLLIWEQMVSLLK